MHQADGQNFQLSQSMELIEHLLYSENHLKYTLDETAWE